MLDYLVPQYVGGCIARVIVRRPQAPARVRLGMNRVKLLGQETLTLKSAQQNGYAKGRR